ncbi:MAG: hypothetical protein KGZ82_11215 [Bacteroidales bacterium]|nr:hypothetical protein [Bacteroidales bacterium]
MNKKNENNILISLIANWSSRILSPLLRSHPDFLALFFKREGIDILGKGFRSFWILLSIMILTFIAIGFSNGSLTYLEKKMSDPFINWINIDIPFASNGLSTDLLESLDKDSISNRFGYSSINGYYKYDLIIWNFIKSGLFRSMGRTIEFESPLLEVIFQKDNFIIGRTFRNEKDIGFIVTENFLKEMNYKNDSKYVYIHYNAENKGVETDIPIPIVAVVKYLPDKCSFATTPYFYNQFFLDDRGTNPFSPVHTNDLFIYLGEDQVDFNSKVSEVSNIINSIPQLANRSPSITIEELFDSYKNGYAMRVSFIPSFDSVSELKGIFGEIKSKINFDPADIIQLYDYKTVKSFEFRRYDYLAINFKTLDKIRSFKEYLFYFHKVELEMSQIESKENFNFVSKLTRFISLILVIFCTISITMFLSNLLRNHLAKIRMNIGTFKAFGMGRILLKKIYFSIITLFIIIALLLSIIIASLIGYSGGIRAILFVLRIELENDQSYFSLFDWWTLIAVVAILFVSLYSISFNNNRLFNETPGNLVKHRE